MTRPEKISDIDLEDVEFARVSVDNIAADGSLLKAYATFMESAQKVGATVEVRYNQATFTRRPTESEQREQLSRAQSRWDEGQKHYQTLAAVGELEYSWHRDQAENWAKQEGMPFPPEHDTIAAIEVAIRDAVDA